MPLAKVFCPFVASQGVTYLWRGLAISLLLFSLCIQGSLGATYTVYPDHGEYRSIQSAIDTAAPGDTVLVASGTYAENLKVDRRLTLKGLDTGNGPPVLNGGGYDAVMILSSDGIRIEGLTLIGGSSFDGITVTSNGNSLISNTIRSCGKGISLDSSGGNTIEENSISDCSIAGISLAGSGSNHIARNTISKNNGYGILLGPDSSGNQIFLNTFQNTKNGYASSSATWSSTGAVSYQYDGRTLSGELGNYWSDYSGNDGNGDGIGDAPYTLESDKEGSSKALSPQLRRDRYPLMQPWETYLAAPGGVEPTPSPSPTIAPTPSPSSSPTPGESVSPTASTSAVTPTSNASETFPPASGRPATAATAPFIYLGILGGTALLLSLIFTRDARVSASHKIVQPGLSLWALSGGQALLGLYLLIAPFTFLDNFLDTLLAPSEKGIELVGGVVLVSILAYLALSSFALAYGAAYERVFPTTGRIHLVLSLIAAAALLVLAWTIPSTGSIFIPLTAGLLLLSGGLSFWQQNLLPAGMEGVGGVERATTAGVTSSTLPAGFSPSDTRLTQEPHPSELPNNYFPQELRAKYTDIEFLGKGGIARVFRARRAGDGREVAVKLPISFDELTGISFLKEIRAWEELHHENIVQLFDANILPVPYFEMEYLPHTLEEVKKPVEVRRAVEIVERIAAGLAYAHSRGVIHRDLKPHNILLTSEGGPKIADWGLSKAADSVATTVTGFSLPYAAPEQIAPKEFGRTDARTDIYQLGILFYELVSGRLPFKGEGIAEIASSILHDTPTPPSVLNPDAAPVEAIILKCLAKHPEDRYQSVEDLREDLAEYLKGV